MAHRIWIFITSTALLFALAFLPSPVFAQVDEAATENILEEVIVTATKREKNIQDVPIAITAITAREIEAAGIRMVEDLTTLVPNFTYAQTTSKKFTALVIRGLSSSGGIGNDPNIGVYVDGVYIGRDSGFNAGLTDIERVEVLKGPQGTLFGRNSTTGALNITTMKPNADGYVRVDGSVGNLDYYRIGVTANGGLSDTIFGKFTVQKTKRDGYLENTFGGTANVVDNIFGRGQLLFSPNDKLDITLSADYSKDEGNGNNYVAANCNQATFACSFEPPTEQVNFDRIVNIPDLGFEDRKVQGLSATIDYAMDSEYEFTSITAWKSIDVHSWVDGDYSPLELAEFEQEQEQSQFSQEFRIASPSSDRFEWVAGVYYFDQEFDSISDTFSGADTIFAFGGALFDPYFFSLIGQGLTPTDYGLPANSTLVVTTAGIDTSSYAAYASGSYFFNEQWSLTGGLRYTKDKKDFTFFQVADAISAGFFPNIDCADPSFGCETKRSDSEWTPLLSLEFRPNEAVLTYLKYSEGFNSGGFNANLYSGVAPLSFGPETVESWEAGFKSQFAGNTVRLNAAVFYMDYVDKQESFFLAEAGGFLLTNAGGARSKGFEVELTALPLDGLEIFGSVGYANSKYTDFGDNTGNKLQNAPEWQWNVGAQYTWPVSDSLEMFTRADVIYQDDRFLGANNDPFFIFTETTLVNLRLGLGSAYGKWMVTAWGRNVLNDDAISQTFGGASFFIATYNYSPNLPRTYGVDFTLRF
jgi:iron complex outermembrane receptor protein